MFTYILLAFAVALWGASTGGPGGVGPALAYPLDVEDVVHRVVRDFTPWPHFSFSFGGGNGI